MPSHRLRMFRCTYVAVAIIVGATARDASAAFIDFPNSPATPASLFFETSCAPDGDADDVFTTACPIGVGPYDGIAGTVGPDPIPFLPDVNPTSLDVLNGLDFRDIFAFHWIVSGDFRAVSNTSAISISLHNAAQQLIPDDDADWWEIFVPGLPAGDYFLVVDASVDPPYTVALFQPGLGQPNITAPVPEPAALVLLGAGLSAVVRRRRSR